MDLFLTNPQLFTSQDINWWTQVISGWPIPLKTFIFCEKFYMKGMLVHFCLKSIGLLFCNLMQWYSYVLSVA